MISHFLYEQESKKRQTIINTLATVGLWNSGILYLAASIPIFPKLCCEGINNFVFLYEQESKKRQTNYY